MEIFPSDHETQKINNKRNKRGDIIFFTHGNFIIYLQTLQVVFKGPKCIFHYNGIPRDYSKIGNRNNKGGKKIHFFSTFFFPKLTQGENSMWHENVRRRTNNVNLFEKKYIVIPIQQRLHWFLNIVTNLGHRIGIESNDDRGYVTLLNLLDKDHELVYDRVYEYLLAEAVLRLAGFQETGFCQEATKRNYDLIIIYAVMVTNQITKSPLLL
ncbi:hypothetical protein K501DRAFT_269629 [Backusella circina FSU 941]|nr:hypothetical protein K501DRAFT_269629 [Backusella circina FSU 941]